METNYTPFEKTYLVEETTLRMLLESCHLLNVLQDVGACVDKDAYVRAKREYIQELLDSSIVSEAMTPDEYKRYRDNAEYSELVDLEINDFVEYEAE